jgi:hypothetical protein
LCERDSRDDYGALHALHHALGVGWRVDFDVARPVAVRERNARADSLGVTLRIAVSVAQPDALLKRNARVYAIGHVVRISLSVPQRLTVRQHDAIGVNVRFGIAVVQPDTFPERDARANDATRHDYSYAGHVSDRIGFSVALALRQRICQRLRHDDAVGLG